MLSDSLYFFSAKSKTVFLIVLIAVSTFQVSASPGDLDVSFGEGGIYSLPQPYARKSANKVLIQPDEKILVAGYVGTNNFLIEFALMRFHPNGVPDNSFGNGGIVVTDMRTFDFGQSIDEIRDIALQPDGKIVVVGSANIQGAAPYAGGAFAIARYHSDGSLDNTFDGDGKLVIFGYHDVATGVRLQSDGKLIVSGTRYPCPDCSITPKKIITTRLNANGSIDSSFGNNGIVTTVITGSAESSSMELQPDGKIIIAGSGSNNQICCLLLTRLNPVDGSSDASFGNAGIVNFTGNRVKDIALQPDGKIIGISIGETTGTETFRLNPNGTLDSAFGNGGRVITRFSNLNEIAQSVALQNDGKIIVAGYYWNSPANMYVGSFLVRLQSNGLTDPTFGINGIITAPLPAISDIATQSNRKILASAAGGNSLSNFSVMRFLGDGKFVPRKTKFDLTGDGKADFSVVRNISGQKNWFAVGYIYLNILFDTEWGLSTDKLVPADYDGDGKTDIAVFRDGVWYAIHSSNNSFSTVQFGSSGDIPVSDDYDGDGKSDVAVYRQGFWYILNSADNSFRAEKFGVSSDRPLNGDFDGDGKADLAVFRDGMWFVHRSTQGFFTAQFGFASDKIVPADYDGDGKTDLAVFRQGIWYLMGTTSGFSAVQFGVSSDLPVPADYDGDGKTDMAVYRDGIWFLQQTTAGFRTVAFGQQQDIPLAARY